jgi:DMSO/TMAO reductase YedYZ heme-binding membrane subunit
MGSTAVTSEPRLLYLYRSMGSWQGRIHTLAYTAGVLIPVHAASDREHFVCDSIITKTKEHCKLQHIAFC